MSWRHASLVGYLTLCEALTGGAFLRLNCQIDKDTYKPVTHTISTSQITQAKTSVCCVFTKATQKATKLYNKNSCFFIDKIYPHGINTRFNFHYFFFHITMLQPIKCFNTWNKFTNPQSLDLLWRKANGRNIGFQTSACWLTTSNLNSHAILGLHLCWMPIQYNLFLLNLQNNKV